eukprot:1160862-Pelagomonas_calceolata.AAC.6
MCASPNSISSTYHKHTANSCKPVTHTSRFAFASSPSGGAARGPLAPIPTQTPPHTHPHAPASALSTSGGGALRCPAPGRDDGLGAPGWELVVWGAGDSAEC